MTRPQILGSYAFRIVPRAWNAGHPNEFFKDGDLAEFDLSPYGIPKGSWVLISALVGQSTVNPLTLTGLEQMTTLLAPRSVGSRFGVAWAGVKGDGNLLQLTSAAAQNHGFVMVWGTGPAPSEWTIGDYARREDGGVSPRNWAKGPSVPGKADSLALMVTYEATNAMETIDPTVDNGFTMVRHNKQFGTNDRIETTGVASKNVEAGATGVTTVTYQHAQDTNAGGFQVILPPTNAAVDTTPQEIGTPRISGGITANGSNALNLPIPQDSKVGEVILFAYRQQNETQAPSSPHADILVQGPINNVDYRYGALLLAVVDNALIARGTVAFNVTALGGRWVCDAHRIVNVDVEDPVVGVSGTMNQATPANGITKSAWTSEIGHTTFIMAAAEFTANNSHMPTSAPGGLKLVGEADYPRGSIGGSRSGLVLYSRPSQATEGPDAFAWTNRVAPIVLGVTLRSGEAPEVPFGYPVKDQEGRVAYLSYIDHQGQRKEPTRVFKIPPGFQTVQQMLDTPGATWAHRGGGDNWAEMSEYAYDHSVLRGFHALEFSAQRTSDGVWFGMHDRYMDRTTLGTATETLDSRTHTWAQVQDMMIRYGGIMSGGAQPYLRLEEFLEKYGQNYVLILDPKHAVDYDAEMLAKIEQYTDPERCIYKYFGALQKEKTEAAQALGMKTWGFFYQDSYENTLMAQYADRWDILGMDINATTAWTGPNNVLSYGKPVTGHIANSQSMYNLGISKGSRMIQCSNTAAIQAVGAPLI